MLFESHLIYPIDNMWSIRHRKSTECIMTCNVVSWIWCKWQSGSLISKCIIVLWHVVWAKLNWTKLSYQKAWWTWNFKLQARSILNWIENYIQYSHLCTHFILNQVHCQTERGRCLARLLIWTATAWTIVFYIQIYIWRDWEQKRRKAVGW